MLAMSSAARSVKASRASSPSGDQGRRSSDSTATTPDRVLVVGQRAGQDGPDLRGSAASQKAASVGRRSGPRRRPAAWSRTRRGTGLPRAGSAAPPGARTGRRRRPRCAGADRRRPASGPRRRRRTSACVVCTISRMASSTLMLAEPHPAQLQQRLVHVVQGNVHWPILASEPGLGSSGGMRQNAGVRAAQLQAAPWSGNRGGQADPSTSQQREGRERAGARWLSHPGGPGRGWCSGAGCPAGHQAAPARITARPGTAPAADRAPR